MIDENYNSKNIQLSQIKLNGNCSLIKIDLIDLRLFNFILRRFLFISIASFLGFYFIEVSQKSRNSSNR